ncbi:GntR family transcriptional regulator [Siculibacillus lacustris]|uniref:GntR family transcriptional regulator n=2 Tax=Siculibacillus lacustris TaxID=1549641 RepID=A0A4Q9VS99_9HYPH|nr:GntR family transcriptional regulator [Siculibacillus lacustris]
MKLPPLLQDDPPTLADRAYLSLREAIVEGTLAPGMKLSERGLAAMLGVSPQPVREALRRLEGEGMAESRPRSGTYVAELSIDRLLEMGRIRSALEGVAAGIAARRRTPIDIAALRARLIAVQSASASGDERRLAAVNASLHETLHAITGNALLIRSLQAVNAYYHISTRVILTSKYEVSASLAEHSAIVAAVIDGDPETAEALMRAHTGRSVDVAAIELAR